jgi:hypothetical protein
MLISHALFLKGILVYSLKKESLPLAARSADYAARCRPRDTRPGIGFLRLDNGIRTACCVAEVPRKQSVFPRANARAPDRACYTIAMHLHSEGCVGKEALKELKCSHRLEPVVIG